jgi:hypothetical protein
VECLILAETLKPPFLMTARVADTEPGAWFFVHTDKVMMEAINPGLLIWELGREYGEALASAVRADPKLPSPALTPFARRVVQTIRQQPSGIQQKVLGILESLEKRTEQKGDL